MSSYIDVNKTVAKLTYNGTEMPLPDTGTAFEEGKQEGIDYMVDKCLTVTESGSTVVFEPVEGYPLEVVSKIELVQSGTGDPSPDNIRPISGHSKAKLTQWGKNLIDAKNPKICHTNPVNKVMDITLSDTGFTMATVRDNASPWFYLSYIIGTVKELTGKTITASADYTSSKSSDCNVPFLGIRQTNVEPCGNNNDITYQNGGYAADESMPVLKGGGKGETSVSYTVTGKETCKYVTFTMCFQYGGSTEAGDWVKYSNVQVEIGSTATAYEPYQGKTFEIDLGQTVYGGTLNWNTGVLTVDSAMYTFTGQETLRQFNDTVYNGEICKNAQSSTGQGLVIGRSSHVPAISEGDSRLHAGMVLHASINAGIQFNGLTTYWGLAEATVDAMKAYLAEQYAAGTPVQITYKLLNPITIQLTPQEIIALSGINTLCSDTGDTEVTGKIEPAAAYDTGFEEGTQSEYDRFWDAAQQNGNQHTCRNDYSGYMWTDETFRPKYDIVPHGYAANMASWCLMTDLVKLLDECGIKIDTSNASNLEFCFYGAKYTRLPSFSLVSAKSANYFGGYNANLVTVGEITLNSNGSLPMMNIFWQCPKLENITFSGVIGQNGLNLQDNTKLTHDSLMSIINALQDKSADTSGTTWTVTIGSTNKAKLTLDELAIAEDKGWTVV